MSSAAPTTRTSAIAISATTSTARILPELVASRPPSRSPAFRCTRAVAAAGAMPETAAVTSVTSAVNARTSASTRTSWSRGADGGATAISPARPTTRGAGRAAPPAKASSALSVSSCRTIWPRPAPSAVRIVISRPRSAARAEQQAHDVRAGDAQHERDREASGRGASGGRCRRDRRAAERSATRARSHSLSSCSSCAATAAMPACACATAIPGFSFPSTRSTIIPRGARDGSIRIGLQMSAGTIGG